jgi:hypothetical protein
MGGHDSPREAAAQAFDREFLMKTSERRRDCEWTLADFVDGMALCAMHAQECQKLHGRISKLGLECSVPVDQE